MFVPAGVWRSMVELQQAQKRRERGLTVAAAYVLIALWNMVHYERDYCAGNAVVSFRLTEFAREFTADTRQAVARHLDTLEEHGLVVRCDLRTTRGERAYRLVDVAAAESSHETGRHDTYSPHSCGLNRGVQSSEPSSSLSEPSSSLSEPSSSHSLISGKPNKLNQISLSAKACGAPSAHDSTAEREPVTLAEPATAPPADDAGGAQFELFAPAEAPRVTPWDRLARAECAAKKRAHFGTGGTPRMRKVRDSTKRRIQSLLDRGETTIDEIELVLRRAGEQAFREPFYLDKDRQKQPRAPKVSLSSLTSAKMWWRFLDLVNDSRWDQPAAASPVKKSHAPRVHYDAGHSDCEEVYAGVEYESLAPRLPNDDRRPGHYVAKAARSRGAAGAPEEA